MLPQLPKEALCSWLDINLSAISNNFRTLRDLTTHKTVFAVVKADAYGHGAIQVAKHLETTVSPNKFVVARLEEALELRNAGIITPILVLTAPIYDQIPLFFQNNLEAVVYTSKHILAISEIARFYPDKLRVHLKTDVGMGRVGCKPEEVQVLAKTISASSCLIFEGIMSHLPCADSSPRSVTLNMIGIFQNIKSELDQNNLSPHFFHLANSATILDFPEGHFNAVRAGICLYGQAPSYEVVNLPQLIPAMSLVSKISFLKCVEANQGISYGHLFKTSRASRIATIPLGYADGIPRSATGNFQVLIRNRQAPQIGRICMDLFMVDVTDISEATEGDPVLIFGTNSFGEYLSVEDFAKSAGTIGYEITTRIGKRLQAFYHH